MELKKNPKLDYRKKYALFFNIGLVISLALVISAFEMKFVEELVAVDDQGAFIGEEPVMVPVTIHKPPKPKIQVFNFKTVEDEIEIEEPDVEILIATGDPEPPEVDMSMFDPIPVEDVDETFDFVEKMPSFDGGFQAFYKFVGKNLKYPAQARRLGIEGKVFVHFIVGKDGNLNDIKVVKGIGAGCDEEVERIIHKSPKWNPGKQRGVPVKVRMMLPITFRLD